MSYHDFYRLSVHAIIFDHSNKALFVKTTYGHQHWTLPGGAVDVGETLLDTLHRECMEELGRKIKVENLTGAYFHAAHNSHAFVFKCSFADELQITLSKEHSKYGYLLPEDVSSSNQEKIHDALHFKILPQMRKY